MRRAARSRIVAAVVALLLAGCTVPPPLPEETYPPSPDARTHWVLRHRVVDVSGLRVVGQRLGHGEESTSVLLVDPATRRSEDCSVRLPDPGQGGPGNMVGEKINTRFDGHPAVRNGPGAEGAYLMWQLEDTSWVEVSCTSTDPEISIDRVAAAVDFEPTPIKIPFDLELPPGYEVSGIETDPQRPAGRFYLGRAGQPDADLVVSVGYPEFSTDPPGEPTTIGDHRARIDDDKEHPAVWLQSQGRWIHVGIAPSDTGPFPDRSADLPMLRSIAESISVARDLGEPRTWFSAEKVFG